MNALARRLALLPPKSALPQVLPLVLGLALGLALLLALGGVIHSGARQAEARHATAAAREAALWRCNALPQSAQRSACRVLAATP